MANNTTKQTNGYLEQWTSKVLNFSSQYSESWGANMIIGPPSVYPKYGDIQGAWAPQQRHSNTEFVRLQFEERICIEEIDIYETYHGGAIIQISVKAPDGLWKDIYTNDSPKNITHSRIFKPEIKKSKFLCNEVKIVLNCAVARDWCEIDAVMIKGRTHFVPPPPGLETLSKDLSELVNNDVFSDVVFQVDGETCKAHKAILAVRSSYFKAMLSSGLSESHQKQSESIPIPDVSYEAFENMLHYIYTNDIKSNTSDRALTELIRVADRFSLEGLQKMCNYKICLGIDGANAITIYKEATEKLPVLEDVQKACIDYISRNMKTVSKSKDFSTLPQQVMLEIVQLATENMSIN